MMPTGSREEINYMRELQAAMGSACDGCVQNAMGMYDSRDMTVMPYLTDILCHLWICIICQTVVTLKKEVSLSKLGNWPQFCLAVVVST